MTELDYGVGNVTAALKRSGQWDNTLIVVTSDNGGPLGTSAVCSAAVAWSHCYKGSHEAPQIADHTTNFPYRGGKHTWYEGKSAVVTGGVLSRHRAVTWRKGLSACFSSTDKGGVRVFAMLSGGLIPEGRRGTTCVPAWSLKEQQLQPASQFLKEWQLLPAPRFLNSPEMSPQLRRHAALQRLVPHAGGGCRKGHSAGQHWPRACGRR